MRFPFASALIAALAFAGTKAGAAPINLIFPNQLNVTDRIDFNGVPLGNHNEIIVLSGASFGERFAGQIRSSNGVFDVLSGSPTRPLSLVAGAALRNLEISDNPAGPAGNRVLDGLGPRGFPNFNARGEGSVAVLFGVDQSEFGLDILQADGGSAFLSFFRRDGSLIDRITLDDLTDGTVAFRRAGDVQDIAGFSIFNNDPGGLAFDNLRFNAVAVVIPEPTTVTLFSTGALGVTAFGFLRRKRVR
jgi:hypothetical protein